MPAIAPRERLTNGLTVRALREALGRPAGEFAVACGISPAYLSNIEAGRRQPPPPLASTIALHLGVALAAITYPAPAAVA